MSASLGDVDLVSPVERGSLRQAEGFRGNFQLAHLLCRAVEIKVFGAFHQFQHFPQHAFPPRQGAIE